MAQFATRIVLVVAVACGAAACDESPSEVAGPSRTRRWFELGAKND